MLDTHTHTHPKTHTPILQLNHHSIVTSPGKKRGTAAQLTRTGEERIGNTLTHCRTKQRKLAPHHAHTVTQLSHTAV